MVLKVGCGLEVVLKVGCGLEVVLNVVWGLKVVLIVGWGLEVVLTDWGGLGTAGTGFRGTPDPELILLPLTPNVFPRLSVTLKPSTGPALC